ncbi:4817_t:CDS:1, partial [Ambispora leptoticha]
DTCNTGKSFSTSLAPYDKPTQQTDYTNTFYINEPHIILYNPNTSYNKILLSCNLPTLLYPQTINSFIKHLESFNYNLNNIYNLTFNLLIKEDYSIAYVYPWSVHNFGRRGYFITPVESYKYLPFILLSTISDINSLKTVTIPNMVKDDWTYNSYFYFAQDVHFNLYNTKHTTDPNPRPLSHSSHLCYNRFLRYHNLPTLPEPQTIISFLNHLNPFEYNLENSHIHTLTTLKKTTLKHIYIYLSNPNHYQITSFHLEKL